MTATGHHGEPARPGVLPQAPAELASQEQISQEIAAARAAAGSATPAAGHPRRAFAPYRASVLRAPAQPLVPATVSRTEAHAPVFGTTDVAPLEADLTRRHLGEPLGERIVVSGLLLDGASRPVRGQLVEVWQANAAGRYRHDLDQHPAPLDPNFSGVGRCLTDDEGRYRFVTIRPGAYPWRNHRNAWRPAHIHFSLFGTAFTQRLVTQMYFPGDPLLDLDPVASSICDDVARQRLVAQFDHASTVEEWALGYRWDVVLTGPAATPVDGMGGGR